MPDRLVDKPRAAPVPPTSSVPQRAFTPELPGQRRDPRAVVLAGTCHRAVAFVDIRDSLNLNHRVAFNDMRNLRIYAQATADGRARIRRPRRPLPFRVKVSAKFDTNSKIHQKIHHTLLDFFPTMAERRRVTHRWGGRWAYPGTGTRRSGSTAAPASAWAGPYVGDGVATSNLAGRVLRNLILERDEPSTSCRSSTTIHGAGNPNPCVGSASTSACSPPRLGDPEERVTKKPSKVSHLLEA